MNDKKRDELERNIYRAIRFYREEYEKAVAPLIAQLEQLGGLRPRSMLISQDQLSALTMPPFVPPDPPQSTGHSEQSK
jgi:hypothetical protein